MSTFLIAFAAVLCLLVCSTVWCCLAISSAAEVEYKPMCSTTSWVLHRHGDLFVLVLRSRGQTFCWSYRAGYELDIVRLIWADYESGLLEREEASAVAEMVAGSSLAQVQ